MNVVCRQETNIYFGAGKVPCVCVFHLSLEVSVPFILFLIYMQVQLRSAQFEGEVCFRCAYLSWSLILSL